jgi:hypothetical protein
VRAKSKIDHAVRIGAFTDFELRRRYSARVHQEKEWISVQGAAEEAEREKRLTCPPES